ncbi:ATP-dependent RNA helicase HrpA [Hahella sp. CCB-MM4]|uniref:ATP-dependent RNA helicase HrpA n=1 Tax=Hahella sp. (strain CCB-MM4) TaxID=1926491 RepID=UPI000B9AFAB5|nr:ATP-dependent RNA helicase HrpA [Hahella sp. CCB-MM4]OZG73502.1 ATP-dependent RNA helicase HrpA [Hahella sp. CCB-MM4]
MTNTRFSVKAFNPDLVLTKDRYRLQQQWRQLQQKESEKDLETFCKKAEASAALREERRQKVPAVKYPETLPVVERLDDIRQAIAEHQVVIVAGETGSGKTTQLPKLCLDMGRGISGMIGHTQPRRLAARAVANRLGEELQCKVGDQVGFQVRFSDQSTPHTLVKVMTDGILLAETQHDRFLSRYDTIIIDEAHERSLNIDFLLGYLKNILPNRPDLKLIITSATIDVERFSSHFESAPVIEVSGRTYPVDILYRPLVSSEEGDADLSLQEGILAAVSEIEQIERAAGKGPGDILIFMVGEREIRETANVLRKAELRNTEILPLYARLSHQEQSRIFQSHGGRRIVLSTNVAETSLTVPGIRYVIDPGDVRISRYSYRSKVQRLPVEAVSQASAQQRAGRCGRVEEGICIRLYSQEDFVSRPEFTDPEILRTNLASVILQMLALRLGDVSRFPFMQPPDKRYINDGYKLLEEIGAVSKDRKLTNVGRKLSRFPIDTRLARILLAAAEQHCLGEILVIVSALAVQDPRERPHESQQAADQKHAQWSDEQSEFLDFLNLWRAYEEQRQELSNSQLRAWCKKNFLSFLRLREWRDTHRQLLILCHDLDYKENAEPATYEQIHKALLTGLISQVGQKDEKNEYVGPRQRKFLIFPGSRLKKKSFPWMMAAELVETSRLFARTVAKIEPLWIEHIAPHLLKTSYLEPHWSKKRGEVQAFAQMSLYGLVVVPRRRVSYGRIDAKLSRELLIREGLIEGEILSRLPFIRENAANRESVELIEAKTRRKDLLIDDETLFQFYDELLPADCTTVKTLEYWYKHLSDSEKNSLILTEEYLLRSRPETDLGVAYPDNLQWRGQQFKLDYAFKPGQKDDGVTIEVPPAALQQLPVSRLEWLVPGMLREKCEALIRSLPKSLRRNFVPVPDFAKAASEAMEPTDEPLTAVLGRQLRKMTGITIDQESWNVSALPDHLKITIAVVDSKGKVIASGRDYHRLVDQIGKDIETAVADSGNQLFEEKAGLVAWDFDSVPAKKQVEQGGANLFLFPYLRDDGKSVALTAGFDEQGALVQHSRGVARLIMFALADTVKYLRKNLPKQNEIGLYYAPKGKLEPLVDDLILSSAMEVFLTGREPIRNREQFKQRLQSCKADWVGAAEERALLLHDILKQHHALNKVLSKSTVLALAMPMADVKQQLAHLVFDGFLKQVPGEWLRHYPRYLKAVEERLEKMPRQVSQERDFLRIIEPMWKRYEERLAKHQKEGVSDPELELYRWMMEEFRVSFFAQKLGTSMSVSEKKLQKQWESVTL